MLGVDCTSGASSTTVIASCTDEAAMLISIVRWLDTLTLTSDTVTVAKPSSSALTV